MNTSGVKSHIVQWLSNYIQESNTKGFVIGVSGGIDSAVTSVLAAETDLPLLCLEMPIHQDESQSNRAVDHLQFLKDNYQNVSSIKVDLTNTFDSLSEVVDDAQDTELYALSLANVRARLRMTTLYHHALINGYLVLGTGNKVEDFGVGFYTKYGDGGVDLSPIADLLKSEVYQLGKELNIAPSIMEASPTDGLWGDDRTDEDQLGATYDELEWAMEIVEMGIVDFTSFTSRQQEVFQIYTNLNTVNQHKMNEIPVCKIPQELK